MSDASASDEVAARAAAAASPSGRSIGAIVAWVGGSAIRRAVALTIIAIALMTPGVTALGPTDRDEARYAQATKQMLETGDYVDIRFQDIERHKKPVGIYWAQAASASAFGGAAAEIWAYRIPSLIGGVLASLLTMWAVRPLIGGRAAFLAGCMTAALVLLNVEARIAKTDAALLAAIVAAMGALARLWFGHKDGPREAGFNMFVFWTALAVGVLLKGPIVFMPVVGALLWLTVTVSAPQRRVAAAWGRLGWSWGVVWLLLLAAPWFVAIGVKTEGAFFTASLVEDMAAKVATGQEAHWGPPGYYAAAFWGTFWPWTALAPIALYWTWTWRRAPETAFLLGWIVPTWIVFELVSTKLPHYVLPTYPAICALVAAAALDGSAKPRGALFWVGAVLFAIPALALPIAFAAGPPLMGGELRWETLAAAGAALFALAAAWRWLMRGLWLGFIRSAIIGAGLLYVAAFQFGFPSLSPIWTSGRMAALAVPIRECVAETAGAAPIATVGYHEPSLVFLTGREIDLIGPRETAAWLADNPQGVVWVERRRLADAESGLAASAATLQPLVETEGFNYNRGRDVVMTLYGRSDAPIVVDCANRLADAARAE